MKANEWKLKLDELKLVVDLAVEGLPWCGDLALQKVVYLLESVYRVDLGYEFGYHHMGPYSFDLANDLAMGIQSGEWTKQSKPIADGRYWVNQYQVLHPVEAKGDDAEKVKAALRQLLTDFKAQNDQADGRRFELVATIHFLRHALEISEDELEAVLRALKPKYSKDEFQEGVQKLESLEHSAKEFTRA